MLFMEWSGKNDGLITNSFLLPHFTFQDDQVVPVGQCEISHGFLWVTVGPKGLLKNFLVINFACVISDPN